MGRLWRILALAGILAPSLLTAQDEVVLTSGQSIRGVVSYIGTGSVTIQPTGAEKNEKVDASQISTVRKLNSDGKTQHYISRKIGVVNFHDGATVNRLLLLQTPGRIAVFTMSEGYMSSNITQYYLLKEGSDIIWIGSNSGMYPVTNDVLMAKEVTRQVSLLFSDYPELRTRFDADRKNTKRKIIRRYVIEYNDWYLKGLPK